MESFVLDVSACLPWCYEDEPSALSEQLLDLAGTGSRCCVYSRFPPCSLALDF
jgi:hypothetical protein